MATTVTAANAANQTAANLPNVIPGRALRITHLQHLYVANYTPIDTITPPNVPSSEAATAPPSSMSCKVKRTSATSRPQSAPARNSQARSLIGYGDRRVPHSRRRSRHERDSAPKAVAKAQPKRLNCLPPNRRIRPEPMHNSQCNRIQRSTPISNPLKILRKKRGEGGARLTCRGRRPKSGPFLSPSGTCSRLRSNTTKRTFRLSPVAYRCTSPIWGNFLMSRRRSRCHNPASDALCVSVCTPKGDATPLANSANTKSEAPEALAFCCALHERSYIAITRRR